MENLAIFLGFRHFLLSKPGKVPDNVSKLNLLFRRRIYLRRRETYDSFNAYAQ